MLFRNAHQIVHVTQHALGLRDHRDTHGRENHLPVAAFDKGDFQFFFEFADLRRQRRLTDEARFGGATEMQMLGQCDQITQVAEIHQSRLFNPATAPR